MAGLINSRLRVALYVLAVGIGVVLAPRDPLRGAVQADRLDRAFDQFWEADNVRGRMRAADRIIETGTPFEAVLERLQKGRRYSAKVPTGQIRWVSHVLMDAELATTITVPRDYDPTQQYPVRVQLHGGIARDAPRERRRQRQLLESTRATIHVQPSGFSEAQWWFSNQVDNLDAVLDRLKRTYNIDENRVHLIGVSDGGTGAYFYAFRHTTPWSSFIPLNGHPRVLANLAVRADGEMFAANLANKPLYVVNGGRDPLYPADTVVPYLEMFQKAGAVVDFHPKPAAAHETSWWVDEQIAIDDFVDDHPRDPLPDALSWETERTDRYNRAHWLVIDRLDATRAESALLDVNEIQRLPVIDFGMRVDSRVASGTRVVDVVNGSDAQKMGLHKGDTVLEVDDRRVGSAEALVAAMQRHEDGRPIRFAVRRRSERVELSIPFPPHTDLPPPEQAFPRGKPSGRVDLVRKGNRVEARTRGVGTFTLLLSPARFDFTAPVAVVVNGQPVFDDRVAPAVETLLRWAARDQDRSMLFGAEIKIDVPTKPSSR